MNKRTIFAIAKKEFFSFLNTPLFFVVAVPFLLISIFIFMRTSLVVGEASLRPYFELLPWFLILVAPALSMKLLTDEKKENTLDLLFSHPVSETEIVLGKFLGAYAFFWCLLLTTIILPLTLLVFANPDPGIILTQYLGAGFVAATFLAIGLFASSYVDYAVGSFLLACAISFSFILIGLEFVTLMFPWPFSRIASELSIMMHLNNIARGVLDIRDILYFISISALFLTATIMKLSQRKLTEKPAEKRKLQLALLIIFGIGVASNVLISYYPLRLDLTSQRLFTLSNGSKQTLKNLPDIVNITVFSSHNLPGTMQLTLKEVEDLLADYQKYSRKIKINTLYPDVDPKASQEAQNAGIREITFNKIGGNKLEMQSGFMGISIRFADKTEAIPFIQETSDLEYQLTRRIRKLTADQQKTIGIFNNSYNNYSLMDELISTLYKTDNIDLTQNNIKDKINNYSLLLVIDDGSKDSTASGVLADYLKNGGKVLLFANGVNFNPQYMNAAKSTSKLTAFTTDYGIKVNSDLVYDLELNEILSFGGGAGSGQYALPYPFWLRALPENQNLPVLSAIKSITFGWPSSLAIENKNGVHVQNLWVTSPNAGSQTENYTPSPTDLNRLGEPRGEKIILSSLAEKGESKLIVVGNSNIVTDQFLQNFSENAAFLTNAVDFLAADKDLASIPRKTATRAIFNFKNPYEIIFYQWGNIIIPPLFVTIFAIVWLSRRKKRALRSYEK